MKRFHVLATGLGLLAAVTGSPSLRAQIDPLQVWTAAGGEAYLELRADLLPAFGLQVEYGGRSVRRVVASGRRLSADDHLVIEAPYGDFAQFLAGRIALDTGWLLRHGDRAVPLDRLTLTPRLSHNRQPTLEARDAAGRHLLSLTHLHILAEHWRGLLTIHNADVVATPRLAALLGLEALADMPIGTAWLDVPMYVPAGAETGGSGSDACERRSQWPQDGHVVDIRLLDIETVVQRSPADPATGRIKVVPSATLRNVGDADVPWVPKFSSLDEYPYDPPDQHPFLVWNLYRIADGRIEQLGASGAKHAFFAANTNCSTCGSRNVLWPGCEDVYGVGTNERGWTLGPRSEVAASSGGFRSTCSFFDQDCDGRQDPGAGSRTYENRLLVDPADLETPGAEYFVDAWYVVQYDTDIWNSMGYRPVTPVAVADAWGFELGAFVNGRVVDRWVDPDGLGETAEHVQVTVPSATPNEPYPGNLPQGHVSVLVQVHEVAPQRFRYSYAVQNFDLDRGVASFRLPLPAGATVFDTRFRDIDDDPVNDWAVTVADAFVLFTAPPGNALPWFTLFNFEVEVDASPVAGGVVLGLGGDAVVPALSAPILAPDATRDPCRGWDRPWRPSPRSAIGYARSEGTRREQAYPWTCRSRSEPVNVGTHPRSRSSPSDASSTRPPGPGGDARGSRPRARSAP